MKSLTLNDLEFIGILGIGGFGRVELRRRKDSPDLSFALKCLKKVNTLFITHTKVGDNTFCQFSHLQAFLIFSICAVFCRYCSVNIRASPEYWRRSSSVSRGAELVIERLRNLGLTSRCDSALLCLWERQLVYCCFSPWSQAVYPLRGSA